MLVVLLKMCWQIHYYRTWIKCTLKRTYRISNASASWASVGWLLLSSKMDLVLKSLSILQGTQNEQKTTLNSIAATQSSIIARLDRMESNISDTNKRVSDVETSQTFLSDQYDTVSTCTSVNKNMYIQCTGWAQNFVVRKCKAETAKWKNYKMT